MPNFAKQFQEEVRRLVRKEIKEDLQYVRKQNAELRRQVAALKRSVSKLESTTKRVKKIADAKRDEDITPEETEVQRARISSKTIRTLRGRLGLTQAEFAKLVGVTGQSVYQWERADDRLNLRRAAKKAVVEAKALGAREARERLDAMK